MQLKRLNLIIIKLVVILFLSAPVEIYAQNRKSELQADVRRLEKEIAYTNDLLQTTRQNKSSSLEELLLLNKKIEQRENLISAINAEINELTTTIEDNTEKVERLNKELDQLKKEYGKLIYYAYKNRNSSDRLMFIFSAESFNQAYQRLKYLQYYGTYRKNQAALIEQTKDTLNKTIASLEFQKNEKEDLLASQKNEVRQLSREKSQKQKTISNLSKKERGLRKSLRDKQKEADRLNQAIQDIIAAEIKLAEEKANTEKRTASIAMTPEEHLVSNNFYNNKGRLPWPSARGVISSTFGEHNHPVLKKVRVQNNGIDILTTRGEKARSIFDGTVISVRTLTNNKKAVIIRHGEYFTVYSNLSDVYVRQGDQVKTKQEIGLIFTDGSSAKTELHFEIWKGKSIMNPAGWISQATN